MSREVLLTLLGTLLAINVGVLISVAILSRRKTTDGGSGTKAAGPSSVSSRPAALAAPTGLAPPTVPNRHYVDVSRAHLLTASGTSGNGHSNGSGPPVVHTPAPVPSGSAMGTGAAVASAAVASRATRAGRGGSRSRRFTLPPLEEDNGSSARSIEAFLENVQPTFTPTADRPHRRRHRARRPAGARSSRSSIVLSLDGFDALEATIGSDAAARINAAFAEALWRTARVGDEITDLGRGRARVALDCDADGAAAYAERVTSAIRPWLGALAVPIRLSVSPETPA